jgi:NuA3 HAT complex component NTO1
MFIPEIGFANPIYLEPIDGLRHLPKARFRLLCYLCRRKKGACIQCAHPNCFQAFHVTCARMVKLCMKMGEEPLKVFCDKHNPVSFALFCFTSLTLPFLSFTTYGSCHGVLSNGKFIFILLCQNKDSPPVNLSIFDDPPKLAATLATAKKPKSFMVPNRIMGFLKDSIKSSNIRMEGLGAIARYWCLRRQSRRGAPLLRRLHLEPWTAQSKAQTDEQKRQKYEVRFSREFFFLFFPCFFFFE